jgi:hypothetical protein
VGLAAFVPIYQIIEDGSKQVIDEKPLTPQQEA